MAMQLKNVVPFGRSFDEYVKMFLLSPLDLSQKILGVADGPASFNSEATKQGFSVTSIDLIYQFTEEEIKQRFEAIVDDIIDQVKATPDDWVWSYHQSPEGLRNSRNNTLNQFLEDYELGKKNQRYRLECLPNLSFCDNSFDLVLCSHFLFLYSDHYDLSFHEKSIQEMLRVGREVRIFPLLTLNLQPSPYLDSIQETLTEQGYNISIIEVKYQFQKGGNKMLVIQSPH